MAGTTGDKKSVYIIGAGMAGLAAARRLASQNGPFDVTVLEAHPSRYGGRVHSYEVPGEPGKPVDLGAMWIHGGTNEQHPLTMLCRRFGIKTVPHDVLHPAYMMPYDENGLPLSPTQALGAMIRLNQLLEKGKQHRQLTESPDVSFRELFNDLAEEHPQFMNQDYVKYLAATSIESYNGAVAEDISAKFINGIPGHEDHGSLEGTDTIIPSGYKALLDKIVTDGPKFHILFDRRVERVAIDIRNDTINLLCSDQTNRKYRYKADHVIIAVSLGVLKARCIHFEPSLTPDHFHAIDRLGFGNMVKVLLVYDEPFWPNGDVLFTEAKRTVGWPLMFVNMRRVNGLNGLVAMLASYAANLADSMTDKVIIERVIDKLTTIVGTDRIANRRLVYSKVTRWRNDPLFRGTYSYGKVGMTTKDAFAIRQPISHHIFFAGEHTQFPEGESGTVFAAYASGQRAAEEILNIYDSNGKKVRRGPHNVIMSHL